jgi:hypothetical protein
LCPRDVGLCEQGPVELRGGIDDVGRLIEYLREGLPLCRESLAALRKSDGAMVHQRCHVVGPASKVSLHCVVE